MSKVRFAVEIVGWLVVGSGAVIGVMVTLVLLADHVWKTLDRQARSVGMAWVAARARKRIEKGARRG